MKGLKTVAATKTSGVSVNNEGGGVLGEEKHVKERTAFRKKDG